MSRDLPSDSGGFGQGQGCLPGRGAKVGRENRTQNRMALLRVGEAGLWDTGPAVHHRGGANGTRARELQENRRWTMAVPGSSRRFPESLGKPALSPLSRRARGLRGPAPLAFASGVWLHFNFPRVTCAMLPSLRRLSGLLLLVPCHCGWGPALAHCWRTLGGPLESSELAWGPDGVAGTAQ